MNLFKLDHFIKTFSREIKKLFKSNFKNNFDCTFVIVNNFDFAI
jgi:hypothetical protein